ncbi:uncharacterized protein LOC116348872 [Contarinia nasturtii]|uniref:uncharacterized protein LOC116348872 n=1 Tax=Contarinia nasturtii TaxID=265458 RepID=UPI0012D428BA|nr:uncharacterized protein LOC116348872 [Contarinia nasturtii]
MISRIYSVYLVAILVLCDSIAAQQFCHQIQFNRNTFSKDMKPCGDKSKSPFVIKDFNENFKPHISDSKQYLSNNFVNSCAELAPRLSLTANSSIHANIYLKKVKDEFVEIVVYDASRNQVMERFRQNIYGNFNELVGRVRVDVPNAKIEIIAGSITAQSMLAIEYLYVLNSAINTKECRPPYKPEPFLVWWVIIAVSLGILCFILLSVGIYCIIDRRQKMANQPK